MFLRERIVLFLTVTLPLCVLVPDLIIKLPSLIVSLLVLFVGYIVLTNVRSLFNFVVFLLNHGKKLKCHCGETFEPSLLYTLDGSLTMCSQCNKFGFQNPHGEAHERKCLGCSTVCSTGAELHEHMEAHPEHMKDLKCPVCREKFPGGEALREHCGLPCFLTWLSLDKTIADNREKAFKRQHQKRLLRERARLIREKAEKKERYLARVVPDPVELTREDQAVVDDLVNGDGEEAAM